MQCSFLVPGLSEKYRSGGLMVIQDVAQIFEKLGLHYKFITTHESHPDGLEADRDCFAEARNDHAKSAVADFALLRDIFVVTWGPLVEAHISQIREKNPGAKIIYYAQSFGWGIKIPSDIPIICVSRYVMEHWKKRAPANFVSCISPPLHSCFQFKEGKRDIDILVHTRKQNDYCLKKLLPALQTSRFTLHAIHDWVPQEEFAELLKRTKLFLYLTKPHRHGLFRRFAEGFGLPALEAVACGTMVYSNLLGGVNDFLVPGGNCLKLAGDLKFDLGQIRKFIENPSPGAKNAAAIIQQYSQERIQSAWQNLLSNLPKNKIFSPSHGGT